MPGRPHDPATPLQIAALRRELLAIRDGRHELSSERQTEGGLTHLELVERFADLMDDALLDRNITARNGSVPLARDLLLGHFQWRLDYGLEGIVDEDFEDFEERGVMQWNGTDRDGHPCLVIYGAQHDPSFATPERTVRYMIHMIERGFREYEEGASFDGKFVAVLFCQGISKKNADIAMLKLAGSILENNYPERQFASFIMPVGALIRMIWRVVSAFLDPGTVYKIRLLPRPQHPSLATSFDPEQIAAIVSGGRGSRSPMTVLAEGNREEEEEKAAHLSADSYSDSSATSGSASASADEAALTAATAAEAEVAPSQTETNTLPGGDGDDGGNHQSSAETPPNASPLGRNVMGRTQPRESRSGFNGERRRHPTLSPSAEKGHSAAQRPPAASAQAHAGHHQLVSGIPMPEFKKRGILYKQRDTTSIWRKRYFVLSSHRDRPCLNYYGAPGDTTQPPMKRIFLAGSKVLVIAANRAVGFGANYYPFQLTPRSQDSGGKAKAKTYLLASEDVEDTAEWVSLLSAVAKAAEPSSSASSGNLLDGGGAGQYPIMKRRVSPLSLSVHDATNSALREEVERLREWQRAAVDVSRDKDAAMQMLRSRYHEALKTISSDDSGNGNSDDRGSVQGGEAPATVGGIPKGVRETLLSKYQDFKRAHATLETARENVGPRGDASDDVVSRAQRRWSEAATYACPDRIELLRRASEAGGPQTDEKAASGVEALPVPSSEESPFFSGSSNVRAWMLQREVSELQEWKVSAVDREERLKSAFDSVCRAYTESQVQIKALRGATKSLAAQVAASDRECDMLRRWKADSLDTESRRDAKYKRAVDELRRDREVLRKAATELQDENMEWRSSIGAVQELEEDGAEWRNAFREALASHRAPNWANGEALSSLRRPSDNSMASIVEEEEGGKTGDADDVVEKEGRRVCSGDGHVRYDGAADDADGDRPRTGSSPREEKRHANADNAPADNGDESGRGDPPNLVSPEKSGRGHDKKRSPRNKSVSKSATTSDADLEVMVLNRHKVWVSAARHPLDVAESLLAQMHDVYRPDSGPSTSSDVDVSKAADTQKLRNSGVYLDLCLDCAELQRVKLELLEASTHDRHRFFLRVYNLLSLHASVELGLPASELSGARGTLLAYDVGGQLYTAAEMRELLDSAHK